jgi:hypothetical protein
MKLILSQFLSGTGRAEPGAPNTMETKQFIISSPPDRERVMPLLSRFEGMGESS